MLSIVAINFIWKSLEMFSLQLSRFIAPILTATEKNLQFQIVWHMKSRTFSPYLRIHVSKPLKIATFFLMIIRTNINNSCKWNCFWCFYKDFFIIKAKLFYIYFNFYTKFQRFLKNLELQFYRNKKKKFCVLNYNIFFTQVVEIN